jgi:hypothetical protein
MLEEKMKMKKMFLVFGWAAMGAVLLASCASRVKAPPAPKQSKDVPVILDSKGASLGLGIPDWVEAAAEDDYESLAKIPRFAGKVPIPYMGQGQNLDLLRSWVNNFNVQADLSRRISNTIEATFGGGQMGDKDTPENNLFLEEIVASFSSIEITGLAKEMDYWTKTRTPDKEKKTSVERYNYYVVYSISEEDLNYQIARAMGKIAAKTKEQEEIKADVEDAIKRVSLRGIQAVE